MKYALSFSFLLLLLTRFDAYAQDEETKNKIQLVESSLVGPTHINGAAGWTLAERMAHYNVHTVSIAVIHNYKLEWARGYGWADKTLKIPATENTIFQAGSISKSLNAVGMLMLAQEGKIDLYTDINRYLTSWQFPYNGLSKNKKITIANLLSHTAGLNVDGFTGYKSDQQMPSVIQILDGAKPANSPAVRSVFEPGLRYEYSGGGTTIAQLIITDVTHQPYDIYMQEQIFKPLGMTNSTFMQASKNETTERATGYYESGKQVEGKYHLYPEQAAAGLWTTPADMARYIIAIQEAYKGKANGILTPDMAKLMLTPYIDQRAGMGVFIDDFDGEQYFEHDGLTFGFYSQYYGSLKDGNGVVIMTNSVNTDLVSEIVNSIAKVYNFKGLYRSKLEKDVKVDDALLQSYTGQYKLAPGAILAVTKEGPQLYVKLTGQDKMPVFAQTESKFYLKAVDAQLEFIKDEDRKITKVILYQGGSANNAPKIK